MNLKMVISENQNLIYSDAKYWDDRWKVNEIGFHRNEKNPALVKHLDKLTLNRSNLRILVPFCGKTFDIPWLASLGHYVVGIEFSKEPCEQLFEEHNLKYSITELNDFKLYTSEDKNIRIYNGDFFKFNLKYEQPFDCVWDRGGLVAIPNDLRKKYAPHILNLLSPGFIYLLNAVKYDPNLYTGPPFYLDIEDLNSLYGPACKVEFIDEMDYRKSMPNGVPSSEMIFLITKSK